MNESEIATLDNLSRRFWEEWAARLGPPVPVRIDRAVWEILLRAAKTAKDPINKPRVFRLLMKRRVPRHVVLASELANVTRTERGIIRWVEGGYPSTSEPLRKGGNAFIRGDTQLRFDDAWWMGREQTDLRVLLAKSAEAIRVSAWWVRGGVGKSEGTSETNGELWSVRLLIGD
jgi:hypothetical protein